MTNEEKILQAIVQLNSDMAEIKSDMAEMKERQSRMEATLARVAVTQENVVLPKLQLLAEGHVTLQEQIKRLSVIDSMQDDISTLKTAVRYLSQELEKMKSAM